MFWVRNLFGGVEGRIFFRLFGGAIIFVFGDGLVVIIGLAHSMSIYRYFVLTSSTVGCF